VGLGAHLDASILAVWICWYSVSGKICMRYMRLVVVVYTWRVLSAGEHVELLS
jgi:hypothetical protein